MRDLSLIVLVRHEKGPQACFACLTGAAAANSAVRLVVWSFSPEYLRHSDFAKLFPLQASKQRAQKTLPGEYHNISTATQQIAAISIRRTYLLSSIFVVAISSFMQSGYCFNIFQQINHRGKSL